MSANIENLINRLGSLNLLINTSLGTPNDPVATIDNINNNDPVTVISLLKLICLELNP